MYLGHKINFLIRFATLKKCAMRYCSCVTDLLLLGKTANYCSCTDQLLLMHRPTIAHALTEQLLVGYRAIIGRLPTNYCSRTANYCSHTDQLLLMHWQSNYWSVTEQLLVGYPPTIDHIMGNNTASRNTYYWSYIWPSTGRIIFWVHCCYIILTTRTSGMCSIRSLDAVKSKFFFCSYIRNGLMSSNIWSVDLVSKLDGNGSFHANLG
jgi:hypothetical protein